MAVLTDEDAGQIRALLYRNGFGKEELKALPNLPTKNQFKNALQVLEDFWTDNAAQLKADVEAELGASISNALAKKIGRAWLEWKTGKGG